MFISMKNVPKFSPPKLPNQSLNVKKGKHSQVKRSDETALNEQAYHDAFRRPIPSPSILSENDEICLLNLETLSK